MKIFGDKKFRGMKYIIKKHWSGYWEAVNKPTFIIPKDPCVNPTCISKSYVRDILQVSNDGATELGNGARSHMLESIFHSFPAGALPSPSGMFILL